jgi:hypothetical protein
MNQTYSIDIVIIFWIGIVKIFSRIRRDLGYLGARSLVGAEDDNDCISLYLVEFCCGATVYEYGWW